MVTVIFCITGVLVSIVCESLHRSRRRAEAARSDLEKSQQQLRDSEQAFRSLADSAPVLIWMTDTTKSRTWLSRPWLEFTGKAMDQNWGAVGRMACIPRIWSGTRRFIPPALIPASLFEMDYRLRRHDGVYRWVLIGGFPLLARKVRFSATWAASSTSTSENPRRKTARRMLRIEQAARVEAERAALMKDEFLATVSHEMRTPLTAMLGWVQMLRSGSLSGEAVPHALETIERNARAQAKLINDLLDMSRILSGRLRLDIQPVNFTDIVEAAIATAELRCRGQKIHLVREFDDHPESVSGMLLAPAGHLEFVKQRY